MSDVPSSAQNEAVPSSAQKPAAASSAVTSGIMGGLMGLLGAGAGAGWSGVVALFVLGIGLPFGWTYLVGLLNKSTDRDDLSRAGRDAGETAVALAKQGRDVRLGLEELQKADAPTDGFPRQ